MHVLCLLAVILLLLIMKRGLRRELNLLSLLRLLFRVHIALNEVHDVLFGGPVADLHLDAGTEPRRGRALAVGPTTRFMLADRLCINLVSSFVLFLVRSLLRSFAALGLRMVRD